MQNLLCNPFYLMKVQVFSNNLFCQIIIFGNKMFSTHSFIHEWSLCPNRNSFITLFIFNIKSTRVPTYSLGNLVCNYLDHLHHTNVISFSNLKYQVFSRMKTIWQIIFRIHRFKFKYSTNYIHNFK